MKQAFPNSMKRDKGIKRKIAVVCLAAIMVANTSYSAMSMSYSAMALTSNQVATKQNSKVGLKNSAEKAQIAKAILGEKKDILNDFVVVNDLQQDAARSVLPNQPQQNSSTGRKAPGQQTYTLDQLNYMNYTDLTNLLSQISFQDITDLFKDTAAAKQFYNNSGLIDHLYSALASKGASFTANDDLGIPTIEEVLRGGLYLAYYHPNEYQYMKSTSTQNKTLAVCDAVLSNPNFTYGTDTQNYVIEAVGSLIGNSTCTPEIANRFVPLLREFRLNYNTYLNSVSHGKAVYGIMAGVGYVYYTEAYQHFNEDPRTFPSYGRLDPFIDELIAASDIKGLSADNKWYTNNIAYYMGQLSCFYSDQNRILRNFTDQMNSAQKYSEDFFAAASQINQSFKGVDANGNNINYEQLQNEGNDYWMPSTYNFDNNAIQIHAGDRVSPEKILRMYWATKEVESQFFRVYGNDKALEPNNADKVLTIRIFNSPEEYKMNSYLSGLSTDNGGMYIEPTGTFYTYERTTAESVYSLEELFRHEFTHFLQSKYQVPGMWGQGDFYSNNDLVWFDEATAEFFAGSTRTEGVQPRQAIVGYISSEPSQRFTLSTLFKSDYSGWDFYNYGWAYASYIYNNDINTLMKINDSIMNNNISAYRSLLNSQANDPRVEAAYQNYMKSVKADTTLGTPLVADAYVQSHANRNISQIKNDIIRVTGINNFTETKADSPKFSTFKLEGVYTGSASQGRVEDWKSMNAKANEMLLDLSNQGWTGYETVTCYFTDYRVENGSYQFNIIFRGLLNDNNVSVNQAPVAVIDGNSSAKVEEVMNFSGTRSTDADGSIMSYLWDFGDGTQSRDANATHAFTTAGTYTVKLTVTDDLNEMSTTTMKVVISTNESSGGGEGEGETDPTTEQEPNDSVDLANGALVSGTPVRASFDGSDNLDYYYFEVGNPCDVNIVVDNYSGVQLNWLLYQADDTNNYVAYADIDSNSATGTFAAQAGKYYLVVYKISGNGNYTLTTTFDSKGGSTEPTTPVVIYETEDNNTSDVANEISINSTVVANLDANDYSDYFAFNVTENSTVQIDVSQYYSNQIAWVLYNSEDTSNYCSYGVDVDGMLSNEVTLQPGTYYLSVYLYTGASVPYDINIKKI
ncbi:MAG: collagenase [Oscillospiraceae bacterium]